MKRTELLAPAGDFECLKAAIWAGADAVYLGGASFGARKFATNFNDDEMIEAINYAHLYGVKVYVTLNTLIYDEEVTAFLAYAKFLHQNNVDAVIMQDLGMIDLVHQTFPNLEIHASTQMHIHSIDGVRFAKDLGVKRVVMAREVEVETLKKIKQEIDMPLEVFIHGALCVSYSGQCLMSSLIGGRSGNRGACTQCCRMFYTLFDEDKKIDDGYLLSMKDLNVSFYLKQLLDLNIDSLKIEGRMKSASYVYIIVSLYRKLIDAYYNNEKMILTDDEYKEVMLAFNRQFTSGFVFSETNANIVSSFRPNHQGLEIGKVIAVDKNKVQIKLVDNIHRFDGIRIIGKKDIGFNLNIIYKDNKQVDSAKKGDIVTVLSNANVEKNSIVVKTTDYLLNKKVESKLKENKKIPIDGKITLKKTGIVTLALNDQNNYIEVSKKIAELAKNAPMSKEQIVKQITKLGDTIYTFNKLEVEMSNNLFINIKALNELRREAISALNNKRLYKLTYTESTYDSQIDSINITHEVSALISNEEDLKKITIPIDYYIVDNLELLKQLPDSIYKLPRVFVENQIATDIQTLATELGNLYKYKSKLTDFSLNVTNSYSVFFLHKLGVEKVTLSYELNENQTKNMVETFYNRYGVYPNLEIIIYGHEEAMISKYNILKKYHLKKAILENNQKMRFLVKQKNDNMVIYNNKLRDINNYKHWGVTNFRINLDGE